MTHFPIILIPPAIQAIEVAEPPILSFNDLPPQKSGVEPSLVNLRLITFELSGLLVLVIIAILINAIAAFSILITGLGAVAWHVATMLRTYPSRQQSYHHARHTYQSRLELYQADKQQYELKTIDALSARRVVDFRRQELLKILKQAVPHNGDRLNAEKDTTEADLYIRLNRYFPGKIHAGFLLIVPGIAQPYIPDFVYVDSELNLHIVIEVDEPYLYLTGEPVHFVDSPQDQLTNQFFQSIGWLSIRFSEEQIVRYPKSCCKTIAGAIADVLKDDSGLAEFVNIPDLKPTPQWTEAEAKELASGKYRDTYL